MALRFSPRPSLARCLGRRLSAAPSSTSLARLPNAAGVLEGLRSTSSSSWHAMPVPAPQREREVRSACSALVESVQAGDTAWFERVVLQLRGVLSERQSEGAASTAAASATPAGRVSSFPTAAVRGGWEAGIETPPPRLAAPTPLQQQQQPLPQQQQQPLPQQQRHLQQQQQQQQQHQHQQQQQQQHLPPPPTRRVQASPLSIPAVEEPPWLEALMLLERAASMPTSRVHERPPSAAVRSTGNLPPPKSAFSSPRPARSLPSSERPKPIPASGYFPALVDAPAESEADLSEADASRLQDYLTSFGANEAFEEEDPAWARAIRLLEAVPVLRSRQTAVAAKAPSSASRAPSSEHAEEDAAMARYSKLLGGGASAPVAGAEDPKKAVRMRSYGNLLQEAERSASSAAPGASLRDLRFGGAASRATATSAGVGPGSEAEAPKSTFPLAAPPPAAKPPSSGSRAKALDDPLTQAVGRGRLVPSVPRPPVAPDDLEALEDAGLRKEDFVWSEHDFNDGDMENKRVLKGFTKEFKQMAADTPDGLRNPRLLTAALDLALACVKCYELDKADAIYRRAIGECRRRGLPWDVKCIQDMATLRCKQHRQADAAELLEELATKADSDKFSDNSTPAPSHLHQPWYSVQPAQAV
ncbi:unnamed protein product [Polarella glacialis]|uniref:Uncharacterized protein n=1 Tax=Polarella glacialis TaxID=89957 RepID=A0A813HJV9_POLGL|nr:unnamed protein product [Polarella glacialis]